MASRDHMPGYAPALNNEPLRATARQPFPLGVPNRFKAEVNKRWRVILDDVMGPALMDPLTITHMQPSDVPGVLIAAGPEQVKASLQRIADAGIDPTKGAMAIHERAEREGACDVADAALDFMRERAKAITAAEHARRAAAEATKLHPQAGAIMAGTEKPQTLEAVKAEMLLYAGTPNRPPWLTQQQALAAGIGICQGVAISAANTGAMGAPWLNRCNVDKA